MNRKFLLIGAAAIVSIALLAWLFTASTKPLPGEETKQDGRNHVPEDSPVTYNFNPPTGGDHYGSWITKGFYGEPRHDGNLVHSLEHGYIIFWYDCERKVTLENVILRRLAEGSLANASLKQVERFFTSFRMTEAFAQPMTGGSEGSPSAKLVDLPKAFSDGSCDGLKNQIKNYIQKDNHKLIGMPRANMDSPLILTAWGRTLKLANFDESKIKEFVAAFRDNGPEHTVEP